MRRSRERLLPIHRSIPTSYATGVRMAAVIASSWCDNAVQQGPWVRIESELGVPGHFRSAQTVRWDCGGRWDHSALRDGGLLYVASFPLYQEICVLSSLVTSLLRLLHSPRRAHPPMRPAYWRTVPHRGMRHSSVKSSDNATAVHLSRPQTPAAGLRLPALRLLLPAPARPEPAFPADCRQTAAAGLLASGAAQLL